MIEKCLRTLPKIVIHWFSGSLQFGERVKRLEIVIWKYLNGTLANTILQGNVEGKDHEEGQQDRGCTM